MDNPIHNEAEINERKYENSLRSIEDAQPNEGTNMPIKDADTMLTMTVLLLACLALAALAHVIV